MVDEVTKPARTDGAARKVATDIAHRANSFDYPTTQQLNNWRQSLS